MIKEYTFFYQNHGMGGKDTQTFQQKLKGRNRIGEEGTKKQINPSGMSPGHCDSLLFFPPKEQKAIKSKDWFLGGNGLKMFTGLDREVK